MKSLFALIAFHFVCFASAQPVIDSIWVSSNPICYEGSGSAIVFVTSPINYTIQWYFPGNIVDSTNDTVLFSSNTTGEYDLIVEVTDSLGGTDSDTVIVSVIGFPNFQAFASSPIVHCNEEVQLYTNAASNDSNMVQLGIATGANTEYTYPAPFDNWYANAKQQYLFLASELIAAGMPPGDILGLNFPINMVSGLTVYPAYTVRMDHTTVASLNTTFLPVAPAVLFSQNYSIQNGNNIINFDFPFTWNGIDNIVIEICYTWTAQYNYTTNSISPWTTTSFQSSSTYYSDGTLACPQASSFGTSNNRPITGFLVNDSTANPIYFSWTPDSTLSDGSLSNPIASTIADTWYHVTVTDSICYAQDSVLVSIDSSYNLSIAQFPNQICQGATVTPYAQDQWVDSLMWTIENDGISYSYQDTASILYDSVGVFQITLSGFSCGVPVGISDSIVILSNQPDLQIQWNGSSDTFCIGQTVYLNATGTYGNVVWNYEMNGNPQTQLGYLLSYTNSVVDTDTIEVSASFCNNTTDTTLIFQFVDCLGIGEGEKDDFEILVNETGYLFFADPTNAISVELLDISGKSLGILQIKDVQTHFPMINMPTGIYLFRIHSNEGDFVKKVFWK